jgi:serine/threonine-protein kinase
MRIKNLDGYKLDDVIGGGQYTKIYKGYSFIPEAPYGMTVAIKILYLTSGHSENKKLLAQFEREAEIAVSLNHPNIVKVYNFGKYNNHYAIVMEYINGANLKEILYKEGKLPLEKLLKICYEAGKGLSHIHKNKVVHKDVKPDNILISEDFKIVKITDFGIAKLPTKIWHKDIFPKSGTVTKLGIISYVAPEQTAGKADFCSDIYSFGVTIDEVITSKLLIEENPKINNEDYFERIDTRSYRKKTGRQDLLCSDLPVPENLKNILRRAVNPSCELRYHSMETITSDIEKLL